MYETQFGLNKRPFRALATGSDVFVGPQTATAMSGLKKALSAPDAIVSVNGPVGVGKTTIVRRALDAIGKQQVIVTIGRMQLGHDEMLELLLQEMDAELPSGTVQRFTLSDACLSGMPMTARVYFSWLKTSPVLALMRCRSWKP